MSSASYLGVIKEKRTTWTCVSLSTISLFFTQHFAPLNPLWLNFKTRPPGLASSLPSPAIKSHHIPDILRPTPVMCIAHKQYTFNSAADVFYITFNSESEGFNFPRWDGRGHRDIHQIILFRSTSTS